MCTADGSCMFQPTLPTPSKEEIVLQFARKLRELGLDPYAYLEADEQLILGEFEILHGNGIAAPPMGVIRA